MADPDIASLVAAMHNLDPASVQEATEAPVTASLGPMAPLLRKLRHIGLEDEIRPLKVLCIFLKNLSEDEDASLPNRWWMKLVRELLYDVDDHLDEVNGAGADIDLSELLARVEDASKRYKRLQWSPLDHGDAGVSRLKLPIPLGAHVETGGRSTVDCIHMEPPNKLVELLALDDDNKTLKIIPIYGCAGLGKTTVARSLYHHNGWKFQCHAFVSVSQNPDMRGFLSSMLSQLKAPPPHSFLDVPDLLKSISKHLEGKRYFIVIDDLWTASVWNLISRAFPCGDSCSRIITTTQIDDVALACCSYDADHIYKMEPLNDHQSRKVFFGILFGSEEGCPTNMKEVSYEIISKCGGLPLAIITIASMLANESNIIREKLEQLQDSLPSTSKGTEDGLSLNLMYSSLPRLIYNCLPPRLRTCLLYLSMYPQGYVIKKDELVKQWVAEGFLSAVGGEDSEEIAEAYFDALVSRGMLQAMETNNNGDVLSCTVHQMVLDFIRYKSMEENFVITVDYCQSTLALPDKVRRLSFQFGGVKSAYIPESIITSQVRSVMFCGFFKCLPYPITEYGLLQVLILHIWADQENESLDLSMIHELFRLKYLKIECNIIVELPSQIRRLTHLGTLHVDARLYVVPPDLVNLERLLHLRLPSECFLPHGVASMTSLRSLGYFDLNSDSEENVLLLGQLTNLQDLQLTSSAVQSPAEYLTRNVQLLGSILEKLRCLQSVTLVPSSGSSCAASINIPSDGFSMLSPPSDTLLLRRIELSRRCCIFFRLPRWFAELRKLCILKIAIRQLWNEDVDILRGIPSLCALTLYIQTAPAEDRINIDKEGFQELTYFKFVCAAPPRLSFKQGAMPKVQKLSLGFNENNRRSHTFGTVGLVHLAGLIEIFVKLGARDEDKLNIQAAESALQAALKYHPNAPMLRVKIQRVGVIFDGDEDQCTATELKEMARKKLMLEIQEGKKNITEEEEGTAPEISYSRRDPFFTPLSHHRKSVDFLRGAIGPLLITKLWDYNLSIEAGRSVHDLHNDLVYMSRILLEVARGEPKQLHKLFFNVCARDIRDLSYDAEDAIDSFLLCVQGSRGATKWHMRVDEFVSRWKARREIAHTINGIMRQSKVVTERLKLFMSSYSYSADQAPLTIEPNLSNMYAYTTELVGIKGSRDDVIRKLLDGTHELKIVSIVGIGGLGKTTLAKSVYDRIQVQFDCRAFVSVSLEPDIKKILMDILLQIDKQKYTSVSTAALDTMQLTAVIRGVLANKRYLIIVDEICDETSWEIINCVQVDSRLGSRVVRTTRSANVTEKAGGVYMLNELSLEDSLALFNTRLFFGSEEESTRGLQEVSTSLLMKCRGVPLHIIAVASFLAQKQGNNWSKVNENRSNEVGGDADLMNSSNILEYIISNLPYHLKACLFHLRIFPVGNLIRKETLIWKWAAEGFIVAERGTGLFELGEAYFKELVNRNMVMPVEDDSHCGLVIGCRVHHLVLDVIRDLSSEENFVTVQVDDMQKSSAGSGARRLAVNKWDAEHVDPLTNCSPERLRSFNAMGCHFSTKLSLSKFKLLRVIAIEECTLFERNASNLKYLGKLRLLRYLGLYKTPIDKLPEEIGDLVSLQTLDLRGTKIKELPERVAQLRELKCLRADEGAAVPDWMCNLTSLEELRLGEVGMSAMFVNELGELKELRELEIWAQQLDEIKGNALVQSMNTLYNMQVLRIMGGSSLDVEASWRRYRPSQQLRVLHLTNTLSRLPVLINGYHVKRLSYLHVNMKAVEEHDLVTLGRLPALVSLELQLIPSSILPTIKGNGAFPRLRYFGTSTPVRFLPGAMPCLESLRLKVHEKMAVHFDFSTLGNLPMLLKVRVEISSSSGLDVQAMNEALQRTVHKHPNSPNLEVIITDQVGMTC